MTIGQLIVLLCIIDLLAGCKKSDSKLSQSGAAVADATGSSSDPQVDVSGSMLKNLKFEKFEAKGRSRNLSFIMPGDQILIGVSALTHTNSLAKSGPDRGWLFGDRARLYFYEGDLCQAREWLKDMAECTFLPSLFGVGSLADFKMIILHAPHDEAIRSKLFTASPRFNRRTKEMEYANRVDLGEPASMSDSDLQSLRARLFSGETKLILPAKLNLLSYFGKSDKGRLLIQDSNTPQQAPGRGFQLYAGSSGKAEALLLKPAEGLAAGHNSEIVFAGPEGMKVTSNSDNLQTSYRFEEKGKDAETFRDQIQIESDDPEERHLDYLKRLDQIGFNTTSYPRKIRPELPKPIFYKD
jgi:hypothetical protein